MRQVMLTTKWCRGTELNRRRQPFQGCALPPELPRQATNIVRWIRCSVKKRRGRRLLLTCGKWSTTRSPGPNRGRPENCRWSVQFVRRGGSNVCASDPGLNTAPFKSCRLIRSFPGGTSTDMISVQRDKRRPRWSVPPTQSLSRQTPLAPAHCRRRVRSRPAAEPSARPEQRRRSPVHPVLPA
jgi:hypothetical protein